MADSMATTTPEKTKNDAKHKPNSKQQSPATASREEIKKLEDKVIWAGYTGD